MTRNKSIVRLKTAQIELDKVTAQLKEKQEKLAAIEAKVCLQVPNLYSNLLLFLLCRLLISNLVMRPVLLRKRN